MNEIDMAALREAVEGGRLDLSMRNDVLALLDLAARLKAALETVQRDDEHEGVTGATIDVVHGALDAAKEAKL